MWHNFLAALGLLLVVEGIMPFLRPQAWRQLLATLAQCDDRIIRRFALGSMLVGVLILYLVHPYLT